MPYNETEQAPVQSTWIKEFIRSDTDVLMRLRSGHQMIVRNVADNIYENWLRAPSKGSYFHQVIKKSYQVDAG